MYRCFLGSIVYVHTEEIEKSQNLSASCSHPGARIGTKVGCQSYRDVLRQELSAHEEGQFAGVCRQALNGSFQRRGPYLVTFSQ